MPKKKRAKKCSDYKRKSVEKGGLEKGGGDWFEDGSERVEQTAFMTSSANIQLL